MVEQVNGPSVSVAYKDGQPTPAAHAFAKKSGVDVAQLETSHDAQGRVHRRQGHEERAQPRRRFWPRRCPRNSPQSTGPKNMYWRKPNERFVRPVRWLVAMLDGETIPLEFDGIRAGNTSRGHRILASGAVTISRAGSAYVESLRAAKVLGRAEREHQIRKALDAATRTIPGARWREDKALLDTVVNLTEFPSAILGSVRSAISRAAGRSAGHGDARSPEIFCDRRCEWETCAAFSGCAQYRQRSARAHPAWAMSACCGRASTMRASSGRPIRRNLCWSGWIC